MCAVLKCGKRQRGNVVYIFCGGGDEGGRCTWLANKNAVILKYIYT